MTEQQEQLNKEIEELDDWISRDIKRTRLHTERANDLQNAYNQKLTDEEVAKHYNSWYNSWCNATQSSQHYGAGLANQYPDPNYHVELVADELETTWSKFKKWVKSFF